MFWRLHAQRLLVERGQRDVVPQLEALAADPTTDEVGIAGGAYHALWTLNGLGAASFETLSKALKHPAAGVRRAAMQILPRAPQSAQAILDAGLLADKEPLVRLTALLALADQPASDLVGAELFKLTKDPVVKSDKWLPTALTIAASRHANGFLTAALNEAPPLSSAPGHRPGERSCNEFDCQSALRKSRRRYRGRLAGSHLRRAGGAQNCRQGPEWRKLPGDHERRRFRHERALRSAGRSRCGVSHQRMDQDGKSQRRDRRAARNPRAQRRTAQVQGRNGNDGLATSILQDRHEKGAIHLAQSALRRLGTKHRHRLVR